MMFLCCRKDGSGAFQAFPCPGALPAPWLCIQNISDATAGGSGAGMWGLKEHFL